MTHATIIPEHGFFQEALVRRVTVENSKAKEMKLNISGDFYTEKQMKEELSLTPHLGPVCAHIYNIYIYIR